MKGKTAGHRRHYQEPYLLVCSWKLILIESAFKESFLLLEEEWDWEIKINWSDFTKKSFERKIKLIFNSLSGFGLLGSIQSIFELFHFPKFEFLPFGWKYKHVFLAQHWGRRDWQWLHTSPTTPTRQNNWRKPPRKSTPANITYLGAAGLQAAGR